MTEEEWLSATDPEPMVAFLRGEASDRKLRLFACACARRIWHFLADVRSRKAVEVGELFADGLVDDAELGSANTAAYAAHFEAATPDLFSPAAHARACACYTVTLSANFPFAAVNRAAACVPSTKESEREELCHLPRDLFGNPFSAVAFDSIWSSPTVVALAQVAYDNRILPVGTLDPDRLAILSDALEDAGCTNTAILDHLRGSAPHWRGCWVIDALLGKT
jgi:hypothetical protein